MAVIAANIADNNAQKSQWLITPSPVILAVQILRPDALVGLRLVSFDKAFHLRKSVPATIELLAGGVDELPAVIGGLTSKPT